jgi:hypothetical protein
MRFAPVLFLAACGVSESQVQEMIDAAHDGDTPTDGTPTVVTGGITQDDLDALRDELESYTDDAVAGVSGGGGPVDASDITGTLDPGVLPTIPEDKLPLRTRVIQLPIYGAVGLAFTGAFGNSGLDPSEWAHSFVVPADYTPGDPLDLHVVWRASEAGCTWSLLGNFNDVIRAGGTPYSGSASGGILDPGTLTAPATPMEAVDTVVPLLDPNEDPFQRLDAVNFGMYSNGGTCTNVSIAGLYITYESR